MNRQKHTALVYVGSLDAHNRDFYGTPPEWIERCRSVMGGIELDPASCKEANEMVVKADRFFSEQDDGLSKSWKAGSLFLNPPYGKTLPRFASKFLNEWEAGVIDQAIVLVNNTTETAAFELFSRCSTVRAETRGRIQFVSVDGRCNENRNTRGQVFFYCGRRWKRFARIFKEAGCRILRGI